MGRRHALLAAIPLVVGALMGCASSPAADDRSASTDAITSSAQSPVKNQGALGNCWIYAATGWAESLSLASDKTAPAPDYSEDYWTYWTWFDRIVDTNEWLTTLTLGIMGGADLEAGDFFSHATQLMKERGVVAESAFQTLLTASTAVATMEKELETGRLSTAAARRDHALVRRVLDDAWAVSSSVRKDLDDVFGATGDESLTSEAAATRTSGTMVMPAETIAFALPDGAGGKIQSTLANEAYGERAWHTEGNQIATSFMSRSLQIRMQRALNDGYSLPFDWLLDDRSPTDEYKTKFRSTLGAHASLLVDYGVDKVPGFGALPLGQPETRADALSASLDPAAHITELRLKNSWGLYNSKAAAPGYTDLGDAYFSWTFAAPHDRQVQSVQLPKGY